MEFESDVSEFRIDEQLDVDENDDNSSKNISQKLNIIKDEKEYKIYTNNFDEIARAEKLENNEEISKIEKKPRPTTFEF